MKNPICLSPLKFYDDVAKQNHRKSYAFGHIHPVMSKTHTVPPFQFILPLQGDIASIYINNIQDERISENILNGFIAAGLTINVVDSYRVIQFENQNDVFRYFSEGYYYLELNLTSNVNYYSEVFCCTSRISDYLEIEYRNDSGNLHLKNGIVSFGINNFKFHLFTKFQHETVYAFDEQLTERLGNKQIETQVSQKLYKFMMIVPEFICDAMRIIRMCDNKKIKFKGEEHEIISFEVEDVKWQVQGDLAVATCRFELDDVITNINVERLAEYNSDFNTDFTS